MVAIGICVWKCNICLQIDCTQRQQQQQQFQCLMQKNVYKLFVFVLLICFSVVFFLSAVATEKWEKWNIWFSYSRVADAAATVRLWPLGCGQLTVRPATTSSPSETPPQERTFPSGIQLPLRTDRSRRGPTACSEPWREELTAGYNIRSDILRSIPNGRI